jgi:predicted amidophosphoribosyltransferase
MARFLCPNCQEVVDAAAMRFAFCSACGAPLTTENRLHVQLIRTGREQPEEEVLSEPAGT